MEEQKFNPCGRTMHSEDCLTIDCGYDDGLSEPVICPHCQRIAELERELRCTKGNRDHWRDAADYKDRLITKLEEENAWLYENQGEIIGARTHDGVMAYWIAGRMSLGQFATPKEAVRAAIKAERG